MKTLRLISIFFLTLAVILCTVDSMAQLHGKTRTAYPCPPLAFISTSPLPATTIGGDYKYQLQTSGGIAPVRFGYNRLPDVGFNGTEQIPYGLSVSQSGLIQGQVAGSVIPQNFHFEVFAVDSCPSGAKSVKKTFYLLVKPH